jgi:hypothetical protein
MSCIQVQKRTWLHDPEIPMHHYHGVRSSFLLAMNSLHEKLRWSRQFGRPLAALDRLLQVGRSFAKVPPVSLMADGTLQVRLPDLYLTGGMKFIGALKWVRETYDPDWVYRTTVSSYVHVPGLVEFAGNVDPRVDWVGTPVGHPRGIFASGTNFLLSRRLVDWVLAEAHRWPHRYLEDVALGVLLGESGFCLHEIPSQWIHSPDQVDDLSVAELRAVWHWRCRSADAAGQRLDPWIMERLSRRYQDLTESPRTEGSHA